MYNTGSTALASSLARAWGPHRICCQLLKQSFYQTREHHNPCEPHHLSWQWRPKLSPDVNKCRNLDLKKAKCPKYRFWPRFKKSYFLQDITACDPPPPKPKTWSEYLSFLLPDEMTHKPKPATCRKMLEHRRRKCMAQDDYTRCVQGECWPLPTEWYGQGVLHIAELALSKESAKGVVDLIKPCPPASHMITRCIEKKLPTCPSQEKSCLDPTTRKLPYSQFRGAETDGSPPTVTLKCPIKYSSELLPDRRQDKSFKLSCRTYGEFKVVECPKQMFNRYMSVDLNSENLVPVPVSLPGYTPQREIKKGICGRQTLLRPPSSRNFSSGTNVLQGDLPEFIKPIDSSHLQPGKSPICLDKIAGRAGMDVELLMKPPPERNSGIAYPNKFTEKELEKHEIEASKDEESPALRQKRAETTKSKLQRLIEKQERERGNKSGNKADSGADGRTSSTPIFSRLVDLEEPPYQRSKFHSSAPQFSRKNRGERGSKVTNSAKNKIPGDQICSGCPGVQEADGKGSRGKSKCSTSRGGAKGRCRAQRALRPGERLNPLSVKCKGNENSPCMRPRCDPFLVGVANRFVHLSQIPRTPMKERFVITTSFCANFKSQYSQQTKQLLDQCCDELDKLKQQIEKLKRESKDEGNEKKESKALLERCCEEMEQLKTQLESLKDDEKKRKDSTNEWKRDSKDLLKQCCEQQGELKKQIEMLKKSKLEEKGKLFKTQNGSHSKDANCNDEQAIENKHKEKEKPLSKNVRSSTSNCPPASAENDCRKVKEKKERAEQCVQYLEKQNEKLKKITNEMKKNLEDKTVNRNKEPPFEKCEELRKETKNLEETKKSLMMQNEKLKKECEAIKKELSKMSKSREQKNMKKTATDKKKDPCENLTQKTGEKRIASKSVCTEKKPSKKSGKNSEKLSVSSSDDVPEEVKKAMAECVKQCAKKAKKDHLKKEMNKEKKKCKQKMQQKMAAFKDSEGDNGEPMLARFLHSLCCKLQELAKKSQQKKKCCPCPPGKERK